MPAVKTKSGAKSQAKPSTKITISLPNEMLEWCDVMATVRRLERNDIIRQTIALGLILMQAENMRLAGHGQEADEWFAARGAGPEEMEEYNRRVGGREGFVEKIGASMQADAEQASKQS